LVRKIELIVHPLTGEWQKQFPQGEGIDSSVVWSALILKPATPFPPTGLKVFRRCLFCAAPGKQDSLIILQLTEAIYTLDFNARIDYK